MSFAVIARRPPITDSVIDVMREQVAVSQVAHSGRKQARYFRTAGKPTQETDPGNRSMRIHLAVALMATISMLATDIPAFAQGHAGTPQEQQACSRDASRFCRKDLGNDGAVQQCLQAHRKSLSAACRKVFESHGM
jgi:hypothetical protein